MGMLFTKDKKDYSCKKFLRKFLKKLHYGLKDGFSLVEIMAVLVILGVLVALAIPVFSSNTDVASSVVCKTNQYHLRVAEEAHFLMFGTHTEEYVLGRQLTDSSPIMPGRTHVWPRFTCDYSTIRETPRFIRST